MFKKIEKWGIILVHENEIKNGRNAMNFNDLKKGAEEALNKTVEGAKDLADKVTDKFKK